MTFPRQGGLREITDQVTRSCLKMAWFYSSVILVLFVGFPQQRVTVCEILGTEE